MPLHVEYTGFTFSQRAQQVSANAQRWAEMTAREASRRLVSNAPVDTALLRSRIGIIEDLGPAAYGVGPIAQMGDVDTTAPRNTIKDFLEWYRGQHGIKAKKTKPSRPWKFAWWYLSRQEKQALKQERLAGRFGGTGKPSYWPQQEAGMAEVNIKAQHFVRTSIAEMRAFVKSSIVAMILRR